MNLNYKYETFEKNVAHLITNEELFNSLQNIGGHKLYHLEGDQLTHTKMVWEYAKTNNYPQWMLNICILHDIGKIFTSVCNGPDDWSYPHHSDGGAKNLHLFISKNSEWFKIYKWFIENHIKPLFWKSPEEHNNLTPIPKGMEKYCNKYHLLQIVKADLEGSISVDGNTKTKNKIACFLAEAKQQEQKNHLDAIIEAIMYFNPTTTYLQYNAESNKFEGTESIMNPDYIFGGERTFIDQDISYSFDEGYSMLEDMLTADPEEYSPEFY